MKRSTLMAVLLGAGLLFIGSTTVLAAGRSTAAGATAPSAEMMSMPVQSTPAMDAAATETCGSPDGAACSANNDCDSGKCEGGSCCTKHGADCDSSSHCCGHQSCGDNGKCP